MLVLVIKLRDLRLFLTSGVSFLRHNTVWHRPITSFHVIFCSLKWHFFSKQFLLKTWHIHFLNKMGDAPASIFLADNICFTEFYCINTNIRIAEEISRCVPDKTSPLRTIFTLIWTNLYALVPLCGLHLFLSDPQRSITKMASHLSSPFAASSANVDCHWTVEHLFVLLKIVRSLLFLQSHSNISSKLWHKDCERRLRLRRA